MMDQDNDKNPSQVSRADGLGMREIKLSDLNNVVEARMGENSWECVRQNWMPSRWRTLGQVSLLQEVEQRWKVCPK